MGKFVLCYIVFVLGCASFSTATVNWWEDGSLYQIYPRSWKDSDGDGVGDLKGITENLEFLKEIGMTGAWLSPIFKSPMSDFGYDISNFYNIDPLFGSLEDFDALVAKAKKIGLKIILDFVPNHSSDECEWFQKSINREDGYDDFYVWDDGLQDPKNPAIKLPPSNWVSEFGGKAWSWNEKRQQFYLHQFQSKQPDLNFRNAKTHETMLNVLEFWLNRGVDGFRIDAVPFFFEKINEDGTYPDEPVSGQTTDPDSNKYLSHIYTRDQSENAGLLMEWRNFIEEYQLKNGGEKRVLLAEAYSPIDVIDQYFGNDTHPAVHLPFNFNLMSLDKSSNARDLEESINGWMDVMWKKHKSANWVLGNHDNPRIGDRLGKEKKDLFTIILAALPGTTVTYYGEEIGLDNVPTQCTNITCDFRDSERTPFQWNDQVSAGFSDSNKTWLPVSEDYKTLNVKVQRGIERSSLNIFKGMQILKHTGAFKAFKNEGAWKYGAVNDQVFQIIRSNSREEYRILANLGSDLELVDPLCNSIDQNECLMEYTLVNRNSPHRIGEKANLNKIYMMPFEAVVLKRKMQNVI
ncbi:maltase A2-like [Episyrphus balteatus]|uniref:maltase A2-like n=1 Tax=Episyrphus balteatus TaxID=286459 RepID=UPI0024852075|nr:maltase A2-like [Episyrphus balteatus]